MKREMFLCILVFILCGVLTGPRTILGPGFGHAVADALPLCHYSTLVFPERFE